MQHRRLPAISGAAAAPSMPSHRKCLLDPGAALPQMLLPLMRLLLRSPSCDVEKQGRKDCAQTLLGPDELPLGRPWQHLRRRGLETSNHVSSWHFRQSLQAQNRRSLRHGAHLSPCFPSMKQLPRMPKRFALLPLPKNESKPRSNPSFSSLKRKGCGKAVGSPLCPLSNLDVLFPTRPRELL